MKRIISIILAIMTLLLLASCGEKVEYKMYSMGQKDVTSQQGGAEKFYSFSELQFEGDLPHNLFNNPDSPKTKNVSIGKDKLVLSYEQSIQRMRFESKKKELRQNGKADRYAINTDEGLVEAEFDFETGKLLWYSDNRSRVESGDFTIEAAKQHAKNFIESQLGEDALDGFTLEKAYEREAKKEIVVNYRKYLHGIKTSEYIRVWFDLNGNVVVFDAQNTHLFDTAKDELSEKKVKNAEKALLNSLSDADYIQDDRKLFVDVITGIFYLEITADGEVYYINVN